MTREKHDLTLITYSIYTIYIDVAKTRLGLNSHTLKILLYMHVLISIYWSSYGIWWSCYNSPRSALVGSLQEQDMWGTMTIVSNSIHCIDIISL